MAGPNVLTPVYDSNVLMKAEGLELFRDIAGELHGNLPASVVFMVPHIVLMELQYKNDGSPETIRAAGAAYNYLTAPGRPARVRIQSHHTSKELENAFYPDYGPDRTGLFCQSLNGLKEARTLQPYNIRHPLGDDYHTWRVWIRWRRSRRASSADAVSAPGIACSARSSFSHMESNCSLAVLPLASWASSS
ncbi:uncharacterized protein LOC129600270 isoform X4 [Paramacrobiotus metropolitanus]|uniref:uncharacterized protein LOC129600270 isoform X4 n=1 Tax=Paramacrobiotus metropolitanus TaxID=2943436 RepID=UPI0024458CA0|nr:uncharacterized protein LOC129600270 isoform X4 [Paramacrobiotus metropolitanus]